MSDAAYEAVAELARKIADPERAGRLCGWKYDRYEQKKRRKVEKGEEARRARGDTEPEELEEAEEVERERGHFHIRLLHQVIVLHFPECTANFMPSKRPVPPHIVTLLLYHLVTEDGTPPTRHWISFSELPEGNFYATAFKGYTADVLTDHFASDLRAVRETGEKLRLPELRMKADVAFLLPVLPRVRMVFVYWAADNELPAYADFLFDRTAAHHLPTDCYAVLCSWLTKSFVKGRFFYEG